MICTPVGSIPEVLGRRTALFVPPGDEPASRAIGAGDAPAGANCRKRAPLYHRLFTMAAFAEQIAPLYAALTPSVGT